MNIERSGSGAYHGISSITLEPIRVRCDGRHLELAASGVADFNTAAHHNYTLSISPAEISEMFRVVCEAAAGPERGPEIRAALVHHLPLLLRFAAECANSARRLGPASEA